MFCLLSYILNWVAWSNSSILCYVMMCIQNWIFPVKIVPMGENVNSHVSINVLYEGLTEHMTSHMMEQGFPLWISANCGSSEPLLVPASSAVVFSCAWIVIKSIVEKLVNLFKFSLELHWHRKKDTTKRSEVWAKYKLLWHVLSQSSWRFAEHYTADPAFKWHHQKKI